MNDHRNCIHCQAIADGRRFFMLIEGHAKRKNIEPERVVRGLEHAFAMWVSVTMGYYAEDGATIDTDVLAHAESAALKLREVACEGEDAPVSPEFRAETERLIQAAMRSHGRDLSHGRA